jgi:hypothetical protein
MFETFFAIGFSQINLMSIMIGMTFAFFNQGLFGKRIGKYIVIYLVGLAGFYGISYYIEQEARIKYENLYKTERPELVIPVPK